MKKCQPCHTTYFNPEEHPYEPNPDFPLRHGLTKSGDIDWAFWKKQTTWTFDKGVRLLDITRPGGDTFCGFPWAFYRQISEGLERAYKSSAAFHIFRGEPDTEYGFIRQESVVYPQAFLEWAYYNDFAIPAGLEELLPDAIREELAADDIATMFSTEEPPEVPPSLPPDQVQRQGAAAISDWAALVNVFRWPGRNISDTT